VFTPSQVALGKVIYTSITSDCNPLVKKHFITNFLLLDFQWYINAKCSKDGFHLANGVHLPLKLSESVVLSGVVKQGISSLHSFISPLSQVALGKATSTKAMPFHFIQKMKNTTLKRNFPSQVQLRKEFKTNFFSNISSKSFNIKY